MGRGGRFALPTFSLSAFLALLSEREPLIFKSFEDGVNEKFLWEDTPDKRVWFIRDGDKIIIETERKIDVVLDANKRAQADFSRTSGLGDMAKVATIPTGLYWDWHKQGILDDDAAFKRRINSSDFQHLRTNTLKV